MFSITKFHVNAFCRSWNSSRTVPRMIFGCCVNRGYAFLFMSQFIRYFLTIICRGQAQWQWGLCPSCLLLSFPIVLFLLKWFSVAMLCTPPNHWWPFLYKYENGRLLSISMFFFCFLVKFFCMNSEKCIEYGKQ